MKIGIDAHIIGKNKGGVERYVKAMVSLLPDLMPDHTFYIFVTKRFKALIPEKPNIRYVILPFSDPLIQRSIVLPWLSLIYRLDILHVQRVLPPFLRCPSVVSVHDLLPLVNPDDHKGFRNMLVRLFTGASIKRANRVLTVSKTVHSEISKIFNVEKHKVVSIYNGIDHDHFNTGSMQAENFEDRIKSQNLLYIGAVEPRKNLESVLSALKIALQSESKDLSLTIAGGIRDQAYANQLKKMVAEFDLGENVSFTGYISDEECFDLLRGATLFLAPSKGEGFDLPPLEAMACGVPVVCSDIPVHRELFDEKAAFFSPLSPAALSQTLCHLLHNREERKRLSNQGKKYAANFTWENTASQIAEVYKAIGLENQSIPITYNRPENV